MEHEISVSCQVRRQKGSGVTQSRAKTFQETLRLPEARRAVPKGWYWISGKWWLCAKPVVSLSDQERVFSAQRHARPLQTLRSLVESLRYRLGMDLIFHLILIILGKGRCSAVGKLEASKANKSIKCKWSHSALGLLRQTKWTGRAVTEKKLLEWLVWLF